MLEEEPQPRREAALPWAAQLREASTRSAEPSWARALPQGARMQAQRAYSLRAFPQREAPLPWASLPVSAEPLKAPLQPGPVFLLRPVAVAAPAHADGAVS